MLNVEQVLSQRFPGFFINKPRLLTRPMLTLLRMLFHEREVNRFLEEHRGVRGLDFIEKVLEYFDLDYLVSMLYKPVAALLLVGEMFRQRSNTIGFRIGEIVPAAHLDLGDS